MVKEISIFSFCLLPSGFTSCHPENRKVLFEVITKPNSMILSTFLFLFVDCLSYISSKIIIFDDVRKERERHFVCLQFSYPLFQTFTSRSLPFLPSLFLSTYFFLFHVFLEKKEEISFLENFSSQTHSLFERENSEKSSTSFSSTSFYEVSSHPSSFLKENKKKDRARNCQERFIRKKGKRMEDETCFSLVFSES